MYNKKELEICISCGYKYGIVATRHYKAYQETIVIESYGTPILSTRHTQAKSERVIVEEFKTLEDAKKAMGTYPRHRPNKIQYLTDNPEIIDLRTSLEFL